ncbi:MAG: adenylosuccinate synthase [Tissierellia bacterium]|nr:adenylosuccinate synthase [Tissierellia bacterium]
MANTAIVGIAFGDEGKGRMVDYLAEDYDVVVRYQGGNNAGHTVINEFGKNALHLIPSGIFNPDTVNIMGTGMVIDLESLVEEMEALKKVGVSITPENLKISERAIIVLPYHRLQDQYEEERLKDKAYGSTKRGIAPSYGDKYMKKSLQMGYLFHQDYLEEQLGLILEWKNCSFEATYHKPAIEYQQTLDWLKKYGDILKPYITDVSKVLEEATLAGKKVLFEAQLGALRDITYGIYPYTSSSSPLAAFAPVGSGLPGLELDRTVGVLKAYTTCVGDGPFVGELDGEEADKLREAGGEYGASTGRPRRVTYFDIPAHRYGVKLQAATELALTKLDVISYLEEVPVITGYKLGDEILTEFPYTPLLDEVEPVYETLPGWKQDISHARKFEDLPQEAQDYVLYLEEAMGVPMRYISVGPEREALIVRESK